MAEVFSFPVTVYYEDTDFSGVVYHANYLKYFERAREEILGVQALAQLYHTQGLGFVVHHLALKYRASAVHADVLDIRTSIHVASEYRAVFKQGAYRADHTHALVEGNIDLVCINNHKQLVALPQFFLQRFG
jgi:acyl-CoA thioester hydrolase